MPPKNKKEERKRQGEAIQAKKKLLDEAVARDDHLATLAAFATFKRNELDLAISYAKHAATPAADAQTCFDLLKRNMEKQCAICVVCVRSLTGRHPTATSIRVGVGTTRASSTS